MIRKLITSRYLVVVLIVLAISAFVSGTIYMNISNSKGITITTKSINELGITLEVPYKTQSLQYVLLTNNGSHHIVACDLLFEATTKGGMVLSTRKVVYSQPLLEKDLVKRAALITKESVIAPGTKWLISIGGEPGVEPIETSVPPFNKQNIFQEVFPDMENYKQLQVTLNAVVTETGQAFGPNAQAFLDHLNRELLKEDAP